MVGKAESPHQGQASCQNAHHFAHCGTLALAQVRRVCRGRAVNKAIPLAARLSSGLHQAHTLRHSTHAWHLSASRRCRRRACDAHEVDAVAVALAVRQVVAEVRARETHSFAVLEAAHVFPHLCASAHTQHAREPVRLASARRAVMLRERARRTTSASRKDGQPCARDSSTNSANVRPRGAINSGLPVFES
jgi:hypothetical protein